MTKCDCNRCQELDEFVKVDPLEEQLFELNERVKTIENLLVEYGII